MIGRVEKLSGHQTPPIRFGVVGVGYWGPNLVRNLQELEDVELRWVCDLRADQLAKIARRYPGVRTTQRFDDVLEDELVDAIVVATPVSTHRTLALHALDAGKHVMVEKPLAASYQQALEIVERAEEHDLVLMPGHTFLYSPSVNLVKGFIEAEDLGEIYFISTSRVNLGLHQADVSVAWDLAPHDFSILRYWLQQTPQHISALSRDCIMPGTPDVAFINLEFDCRTIAHVELSWLAPAKLRRTTIVGSRKMIVYDDTSIEPVRVFDSGVLQGDPQSFGEFKLTYRTGDVISPRVAVAEPLALEIADFCDSIRTGNPPRSDAGLGLDVVRMIEATDRSIRSNGARVPTRDTEETVALDAVA